MGIIPKQQANKFNIDYWETDASETIVDYGLVIPVYQQSLQKLYVANDLMKLSITELAEKISNFQEFCISDIHISNITVNWNF